MMSCHFVKHVLQAHPVLESILWTVEPFEDRVVRAIQIIFFWTKCLKQKYKENRMDFSVIVSKRVICFKWIHLRKIPLYMLDEQDTYLSLCLYLWSTFTGTSGRSDSAGKCKVYWSVSSCWSETNGSTVGLPSEVKVFFCYSEVTIFLLLKT